MGQRNYFLTGLPRSRTAWLANFMTFGNSFCHHDGLLSGYSAGGLRKLFSETEDAEFVGDSDSGLVSIAGAIERDIPGSPWVLVERPIEDALGSYQAYFPEHPHPSIPQIEPSQVSRVFDLCQKWCEELKDRVPSDRLMIVRFEDLDRVETMQRIWSWCLRGAGAPYFSHRRFEMLHAMRVNVISEKLPALHPVPYYA